MTLLSSSSPSQVTSIALLYYVSYLLLLADQRHSNLCPSVSFCIPPSPFYVLFFLMLYISTRKAKTSQWSSNRTVFLVRFWTVDEACKQVKVSRCCRGKVQKKKKWIVSVRSLLSVGRSWEMNHHSELEQARIKKSELPWNILILGGNTSALLTQILDSLGQCSFYYFKDFRKSFLLLSA